jgi:hypothetical protein
MVEAKPGEMPSTGRATVTETPHCERGDHATFWSANLLSTTAGPATLAGPTFDVRKAGLAGPYQVAETNSAVRPESTVPRLSYTYKVVSTQ